MIFNLPRSALAKQILSKQPPWRVMTLDTCKFLLNSDPKTLVVHCGISYEEGALGTQWQGASRWTRPLDPCIYLSAKLVRQLWRAKMRRYNFLISVSWCLQSIWNSQFIAGRVTVGQYSSTVLGMSQSHLRPALTWPKLLSRFQVEKLSRTSNFWKPDRWEAPIETTWYTVVRCQPEITRWKLV